MKAKQLEYYIKAIRTLFVDDVKFLSKRFKTTFNRELNLYPPISFNEKVMYRMIYENKEEFTILADKIQAKEFVSSRLGVEYITPTIGIYNHFNEINFDLLPERFVMKCNHDSGSSMICISKKTFNINEAKKKLTFFLSRSMYPSTRERHYLGIKPRIICEEYIDIFKGKDRDTTPELFRVHCFNGEPKFIEADFTDSKGFEYVNMYNEKWELQNVKIGGYPNHINANIERPNQLDNMISLSKNLSSIFNYCRLDWFITSEKILFSEFTFTPCAGKMKFLPESFDFEMGSYWENNKGKVK